MSDRCEMFPDYECSQEWCGFAGGVGDCRPPKRAKHRAQVLAAAHCPFCEQPYAKHTLEKCSKKATP